jgi:methylated-DNA-[protein]-cysteine S-methyltransferase
VVQEVEMIYYAQIDSPVGPLRLVTNAKGLHRIDFLSSPRCGDRDPEWQEKPAELREAAKQLNAYFSGKLQDFEMPLAPQGTAFQLSVWDALLAIPYGETISYGELARRLGNPNASRAVGLANGSNPIPIIIPCHRVIGSNGKLTGYGGGLPIKEKLLALERRQLTLL